MKKAPMIIGIVLLILCVGGYFGIKAYNANEEKRKEEEIMKPLEMNVEEVTGLSYVKDGTTLTFHKEGEDWLYSDDTSVDINEETIDGMLEQAFKAESVLKVTAENLSDYGFDTPENVITITTAEGTTEVAIGLYNEMLTQYYISINGSMDMYLVGSEFKTNFDNDLDNLIVVATEEAETESTETEAVESETAESTETEAVEGAETEVIEGTESTGNETAEGTETETVEGTESETVENTENAETEGTEGTESTENETAEGTETETVENTENTEAE